MALEINNAQFLQFVDFAETQINAGKQRAVARIDAGDIGEIANRTIKPGSGDWVGIGVGRLASLKRANNTTRDAFMKAVADMFGGENCIPASVRDAMKMQDYGKGKPLTARRILAVKAAVEKAIGQGQAAVRSNAAALADRSRGKINAADAEARAETLLGAAGGDHAVISVLKNPKVTEKFLTSDKKLRSAEDIAKRVDGLKANVDELREATKGDGAMFEAGLRALAAFGGKALPKGILSDVVRLAKAANLRPLAKLGPGADMASLHKGLLTFHRAVEDIRLKAKVMTAFEGSAYGDELFQAKRLVANILLGRMDDRKMNTIQDLVTGQNAGRLINVYGEYIMINDLKLPDGTPGNVAYEVPGVSMGLSQTLTLLKEATVDAVGDNGSEAEETDVPGDDPIFDIVSQDLVNEAEASIERRKQAVADGGMAEPN